MKIRVLGCAGTVSTESKTSAFLINDRILLDGGTICSSLTNKEIKAVKNIFISHPHFDHIKGLPSLAEALIFMEEPVPVTVHASEMAIESIRQHIMNGVIWPDFSKLPAENAPVIRYNCLREGVPVNLDGLSIAPYFLYHNYSDFGYLINDGKSSLLYTSDIGPDAELCTNGRVPDSTIIEVSFPNEKEEFALRTGHLTPALMLDMMKKLPALPRNIFVSHLKTYFRDKIVLQLEALGLANLTILKDGDILEL
jgi:cAMP phosphodiesterase